MGEIVAGAFKQLLQIALGNAFALRDARRRELGIVRAGVRWSGRCDGAAPPGCACRPVGSAGRRLVHQRQHQFGEALRDGRPFRPATASRAYRRPLPARAPARPPVPRRRTMRGVAECRTGRSCGRRNASAGHRQGDRAHVRLETAAPSRPGAAARRDRRPATCCGDPPALQHRAVFEREQDDSGRSACRGSAENVCAPAANGAIDHAVGEPRAYRAVACRPCAGARRGRAQTKRAKDVLPGRRAGRPRQHRTRW